jgi:hypothetical protein
LFWRDLKKYNKNKTGSIELVGISSRQKQERDFLCQEEDDEIYVGGQRNIHIHFH